MIGHCERPKGAWQSQPFPVRLLRPRGARNDMGSEAMGTGFCKFYYLNTLAILFMKQALPMINENGFILYLLRLSIRWA